MISVKWVHDMFLSWNLWISTKCIRTSRSRHFLTIRLTSCRKKYCRDLLIRQAKSAKKIKKGILISTTIMPTISLSMTRNAELRRRTNKAPSKILYVFRWTPLKNSMLTLSTIKKLKMWLYRLGKEEILSSLHLKKIINLKNSIRSRNLSGIKSSTKICLQKLSPRKRLKKKTKKKRKRTTKWRETMSQQS